MLHYYAMKVNRWAGFKICRGRDGINRNRFAKKTAADVRRQFDSSYEIDMKTGCWQWNGYTNGTKSIYGAIYIDGKLVKAHRYSYKIYHGNIPAGLIVRHICDHTTCVNPQHLVLGTHKQNTADMFERGRNRNIAKHGENHPRAILTVALIQQAMDLKEAKNSITFIAKSLGFKRTTIAAVFEGRTWRHVTGLLSRTHDSIDKNSPSPHPRPPKKSL